MTDEPLRVLNVSDARLADLLDQLGEVDVGGCLKLPPVEFLADRTLQEFLLGEPRLLS